MNESYKILGISPYASDDEVKSAYKKLIKRYSEDKKRISEITEAFDTIMSVRREGDEKLLSDEFAEVRLHLQNGNYVEADSILDSMQNRKVAEWHFLKGSTCYSKGWLDEAYTHFSQASQMEPYNQEYATALRHMTESRSGHMKGKSDIYTSGPANNCDVCDICNSLMCADCCCECMGGDLIGCC